MFIVNFVLDSGLVLINVFRTRFTGTSTRGGDPPKTQPGEEGDLCAVDIKQTTCDVPRVFDQYEIDIEMTKHRHSYINSGIM